MTADQARASLPRGLRWEVLWTMLGTAVFLASQYGVIVVLAKLGTPRLVGQFSLALAIATPVMVISQLQLRQILVTCPPGDVAVGEYFWTRLASGLIALALLFVLGRVLQHDSELRALTLILGIARLGESLSDVLNGALQRRERMALVALSLSLRGVIGLATLAAILYASGNLLLASAGLATAWIACALAVDIPLTLRVGDRLWRAWHPASVFRLARSSAVLTAAAGLVSLSAGVPRYFVNYLMGKEAVAMLAVAMMPISLMGLFTGAVSQATLARASTYLQDRRLAAFKQLATKLGLVHLAVGVILVAVLLTAGRPLIRLLYTPEYDSALPVMLILGVGVAISSLAAFGSTVVTAGRRFQLSLVSVVIGLLFQVPLCWVLIPRLGVLGAAWAELGRYVVTGLFLGVSGVAVYRESAGSRPLFESSVAGTSL